jgi:hypothetical protein
MRNKFFNEDKQPQYLLFTPALAVKFSVSVNENEDAHRQAKHAAPFRRSGPDTVVEVLV